MAPHRPDHYRHTEEGFFLLLLFGGLRPELEEATYLIDPTLRSSSQMLKLRATSRVTWHVDGKRVASEWPLIPGEHTIAAVDQRGHRDEVTIYVK